MNCFCPQETIKSFNIAHENWREVGEKKTAGDASGKEEVISFCLLFAECPTVAMSEVPL